jgi:hypothetical protein
LVPAWAAIAALVIAYLLMAQGGGWNMNAHYALVRAFADGTPTIDKTRLEVGPGTGDYSVINGHYYAAKSPGLAFATLPPYLVLKAAGGAEPKANDDAQVWYLTIWGVVLPAAILLVLVASIAGVFAPGYATLGAITLGVGTMILPFATSFFAHVLSTTLLFAGFWVLWRERHGSARLLLVAAAGVLAGLAATTDFIDAVPAAMLGVYVLARPGRLERSVAFALGCVIGGLPTLLFNQWAFHTPFKFQAYGNLTAFQGAGQNHQGLYGITAPSFHTAVQLLFAPIGLLTLMPVLLAGAVGVWLIYRRGYRAEAIAIAAIAVANFVVISAKNYDAMGGGTPGPRYLMPMLPFLALGIAVAYRSFPVTTVALAAASAVQMVVLTLTHPFDAPWYSWYHSLAAGNFSRSTLGLIGAQNVGLGLFVATILAAVALAAAATVRPTLVLRDAVTAVLALGGWLLFVFRGPSLLHGNTLGDGAFATLVFAASLVAAAVVVPRLVLPSRPITRRGAELA